MKNMSTTKQYIEGLKNYINSLEFMENMDFSENDNSDTESFLPNSVLTSGTVYTGIGKASNTDETPALTAAKRAICNPDLQRILKENDHILIQVMGEIALSELHDATAYISDIAGKEIATSSGGYFKDMEEVCVFVTVFCSN